MAVGGRARASGAAEIDPDRDPLVAGLPGAAALLSAFREEPGEPFAAAVVGPGGSGKSALLSALVRSARRRGIATRRIRSGDSVPFPSDVDALLLVDDAHTLDEATLAELTDVADDPETRVVVTARPWPCPRVLSTLWLTLGRDRAPLSLAPLTEAGTVDRAASLLGRPCPAPLATALWRLSGGSPAIVDRLVAALRDAGPHAVPTSEEFGATDVPPGVLDVLRHEIQGLASGPQRLLLALAVGAPRMPALLAELLDLDRTTLDERLEAARASGLLLPSTDTVPGRADERVAPLTARVLVQLGAAAERLDLERRIAEQALARGASVLDPARRLLGSGLRGGGLPTVFAAAGDEALATAPRLAEALYADAVSAGAAPESVALRRAEAAALAGDLDTALRLADPLTAAPDEADRARAVTVVAAAMAHRGMGHRSAAMLDGVPALRTLAVPGLVATGRLVRPAPTGDEPDQGRAAERSTGSTTVRSAVALVAEGILTSLGADPAVAAGGLSDLMRAAALLEPVGAGVLVPDSPSALAALVAVHTGETDLAESVLRRAVETTAGGPALVPRHRLLRAWISMLRGDVAGLRGHVAAAGGARPGLEPRDELTAAALEVGVARRRGDSAGLRAVWGRARQAVVRHPVDLFSLLPVGELAVGAARLGEQSGILSARRGAESLLATLGDPPLWRATTSWYAIRASIVAEDVAAAEAHLAALTAIGAGFPLARVHAVAARQWVAVLAGEIDATAVESAARGLDRLGWSWDAARLAGEAAIRTRDRKAMASLLACARSLAERPGAAGDPAVLDASLGLPASVAPSGELSEREREVARLVLAGLTQKQIGARLYISSKTVEHHVARMRQRLGATSRGDLFAQLRDLVGEA